MTRRYHRALIPLGLSFLGYGCSVTRPVPVAIDAPALSSYLAEHPAANLRVTEHSGERYWVHAPMIQGDSLIGQRGYEATIRRAGVHLQDVTRDLLQPLRDGVAVRRPQRDDLQDQDVERALK